MRKLSILLIICFSQLACKGLLEDEAQPTIISLINKDKIDFIELTINGKKDSAGRSVIAFSSTLKDKPDFSIGSNDTLDFYFWKNKLEKSIGGTFEILSTTPDQRILRTEFGNIYVNKERVYYHLELSDSTIVRVK